MLYFGRRPTGYFKVDASCKKACRVVKALLIFGGSL